MSDSRNLETQIAVLVVSFKQKQLSGCPAFSNSLEDILKCIIFFFFLESNSRRTAALIKQYVATYVFLNFEIFMCKCFHYKL